MIIGYIGNFIGFLLTGVFFLITELVSFIIIIFYILIVNHSEDRYLVFKIKKFSEQDDKFLESFSFLDYLKNKIHLNVLLLIVFSVLVCVLTLVRFEIFAGTDPWLHLTIIKMITEINYIPIQEYYGTMGFHIVVAVIHYYSSIELLLIPGYFTFYTVFLSALVLYNLFMRIFKNRDLSILGIFILDFALLGYYKTLLHFWPAGITLILCMFMTYLFFIRMQVFIKIERPTRKEVFSEMIFYYFFLSIIFISAMLTHVLTAVIFLLSFIWVYLIYFLKDYKRGFDLFFFCLLGGLFLLFVWIGIGADHFWFIGNINLPWYILVGGIGGGGFLVALLIWRLRKSIIFSKVNFEKAIRAEERSFFKTFEDKVIIPLILVALLFFGFSFFILNLIIFRMDISNVLLMLVDFIYILFGLWGFVLYQKKPKGKVFFIMITFFGLLWGAAILVDMMGLNLNIWNRIFGLTPAIIIIGFLAYIYKLIKLNSIRTISKKMFIVIVIGFTFVASMIYDVINVEIFNINKTDVQTIQWYSEYNSEKDAIISNFGWSHIFMYYDYPYEDDNKELQSYELHYFIRHEKNLFPPGNHFDENGTNILQTLKNEYNSDVFILFEKDYILFENFQPLRHLTDEEIEEYYSLLYIDKVFSSRKESGEELPLYWII
jgi:hypothetical protein